MRSSGRPGHRDLRCGRKEYREPRIPCFRRLIPLTQNARAEIIADNKYVFVMQSETAVWKLLRKWEILEHLRQENPDLYIRPYANKLSLIRLWCRLGKPEHSHLFITRRAMFRSQDVETLWPEEKFPTRRKRKKKGGNRWSPGWRKKRRMVREKQISEQQHRYKYK